nr:hypothetical protein [Verrucomicrobiota bacterium]
MLELDKSAVLEWFKRDAGILKDVTALRDCMLRALARKAPEETFALGLKRDKHGSGGPALLVEELAQENPLLAQKFIERFTGRSRRRGIRLVHGTGSD